MTEAIRRRRASDERGFTLVELLVVIAILGILVAIVAFAVTGLTDNAENTACDANVKQLETAVEAYNAEEGSYPADGGLNVLMPNYLRELPPADQFTYAGGTVTGDCA